MTHLRLVPDCLPRQLVVATLVVSISLSGVAVATADGEFVWADLLTEDAEAAAGFYSALFDWRIEESPSGSLLVLHQDRLIAGISEIEDEQAEIEEATWLVGVAVDDLEGVVEAARGSGAVVHREIARVEGYARYAVIEDPQGALLLLLDPERALGGTTGPGAWIWSELWTDDSQASAQFYQRVLGYAGRETERPRGAYTIFAVEEEPRAGMVEFDNEQIEPAWAPYIGVAEVEATVERARELGGRVLLAPSEELAQGRVALLTDPTGGSFFVYELEEITP